MSPSRAPSPDRVAEELEQFVMRLLMVSEANAMDTLMELDLPISQFKTLCMLGGCSESMPIHEIADGLQLSMAAAGRNVDQLVAQGLVVRREDEHDRRVRRVALSDSGWAVVRKHIDAKRGTLREFTRRLPAHDRERLSECLTSILAGDSLQPQAQETNA